MQDELYLQAYNNSMLATDVRLAMDKRETTYENHVTDITDVFRTMGNVLLNLADNPNWDVISNSHKAYIASQVYETLVKNGILTRY